MATIVVIDEEHWERHVLPEHGKLRIGRAPDAEIRIKQPWVSRVHAFLHVEDGRLTIEDAGSSYGLKAKGRVVEEGERVELSFDDVIELGSTVLVVKPDEQEKTGTRLVDRLHDECGRAAMLGFAVDAVAIEITPEKEESIRDALAEAHPLAARETIERAYVAGAIRPAVAVPLARRVAEQLAKRGLAVAIGSATQEAETGLGHAEHLVERALLGFARIPNDETLVFGPCTLDLNAQLATIAKTGANVLLEGETGVGKHAVARFLAQGTPLHHVAASDLGTIELPKSGTIVIDDVADVKDAKLLAALLSRVDEDVRFIGITRKKLRGRMPDDVFFRLAGMRVHIPSLRDRFDDTEVLARHFALRAGFVHLTDDLLTALRLHDWRENVRELRNVVTEATARAQKPFLRSTDVTFATPRA